MTKTSYSGSELCGLTATEAVEKLRKGEVSPEEMLDASLDRIEAVDDDVNAVPMLCFDRAQDDLVNLKPRAERNHDHPGWLAGLPVAIKDLNHVSGVVTSFGSPAFADSVSETSDIMVETLEEHGGLVIGKTNTPEMGAGGNTFNPVYGITRNAWDTRMNAGGSSGGAAVALATGQVWLAQGSDLAGSLRTPAGYNGVVGLRPSPGRVARGPGDQPFELESVQGPMARNVRDTALFLDAMSGFDPRDPISLEAPATSFQDEVARAEQPARVAYSPDLNGFCGVEADVDDTIRAMLGKLETGGTTVAEECPPLPGLYDCYRTLRAMIWATGVGQLPQSQQAPFKKTLADNIALGHRLTAQQIYESKRTKAMLYKTMCAFLQTYDVFVMPTVPISPEPVENEYPKRVRGMLVTDYLDWLRFSFLSTATGLPSMTLPAGFNENGMPVGVQLIGPPRGEAKMLQVAAIIEAETGFADIGPIDPIVRH